MYVWTDRLRAVLPLVRMGRGKMMGVDHNKGLRWVGASAGLMNEAARSVQCGCRPTRPAIPRALATCPDPDPVWYNPAPAIQEVPMKRVLWAFALASLPALRRRAVRLPPRPIG